LIIAFTSARSGYFGRPQQLIFKVDCSFPSHQQDIVAKKWLSFKKAFNKVTIVNGIGGSGLSLSGLSGV
jgi:hypothetical protein